MDHPPLPPKEIPLESPQRLLSRLRQSWNFPARRVNQEDVPFFDDANHLFEHLRRPSPPSLRLLVVLTTFERAKSARRVVTGLERACNAAGISGAERHLLVLEDRSKVDMTSPRDAARAAFGEHSTWLTSNEHLGKRGFWKTHQAALLFAEHACPDYALFLQDDLQFEPSLLQRALWLFSEIRARENRAGRPQILNLYSSHDDEPLGRWVNFPRRDLDSLPARQTQWFDLAAYLMDQAALKALRYRVVPILPARWDADTSLSSGVGRQLTRRLVRRAAIFQCYPPLVFHGTERSVMNPESRAVRPLDNRDLRRGGPAPR